MALAFAAVAHVNVNCSRLEGSLAFYRDGLGLAPLSHTKPLPQDGAGFGLPGAVQWDAWILHDERAQAAPGIDLLEWKLPAPVGRPARANELGFSRLLLAARTAGALPGRLAATGCAPLAPPASLGGDRHGFLARDPDGALLEIAEPEDGGGATRLAGVALSVAKLASAVPWYERLLGSRASVPAAREADGATFGFAGIARWSEATLAPTPAFAIRLVEWQVPSALRAPARAANALGLYRMALLVEDAARACAQLDALGLAHSGSVRLDMGPDIPIDGLHAGFFPDPDGACLEWIERPRLRGSP
jgi:catechol 2,3-dioxygenase-like lactoylglutathione lyase family enzyme